MHEVEIADLSFTYENRTVWVFRITLEGIFFAVASIMRFLSLATVSVFVIMTTDPSLYAPALAKL